jgi:aspartate kinase
MGRSGDPYATDTLLSLICDGHCSAHETDMIMSAGESISAVVLSSELKREGVSACALTGADAGIITDSLCGNATIKHIDISAIHAVIESDAVAVVTGFQGVDPDGNLHTLGRGGSDTSACALGVALKAERVDIYTDVDGVYTADPRMIEEAQALKTITADELFQMAKHGSRILHAPAAELALQSGVKMRIRSTFTENPGTEVVSMDDFRPDKVATAVTTVSGIARLRVRLPYAKDEPMKHMQMQTTAYRLMADAKVSIDMFTPMNDRLVFTVAADAAVLASQILSENGFEVALRPRLGKVSLIGSGMHGVPGVMAQVAMSLQAEDIDILQVADSHATISVLIDENDLETAAKALHRAFEL